MEPPDSAASRTDRPTTPGQWVAHLRRLVRWSDWADSKLPFYVVAIAYAALRIDSPGLTTLADIAWLIALLCLFASFGHMVNDYSDLAVDLAAGKRRALASWSRPAARGAIAVLAVGTIVAAAVRFDAVTIALAAAAVLLAALYSLPPARLKERRALSWAAAALAQRTLPVAIVFQAFGCWDAAALALTVLATLIGLRYIVVHQLLDRRHDLRSGVRTVATVRDPTWLHRLLKRVLVPLEVATAGAAILAMGVDLPPVIVATVGYGAWLWIASRRGHPPEVVAYGLFQDFYSIVWPGLLAGMLAWRDPIFLPVPILLIALLLPNLVVRTSIAERLRARSGRPAAAAGVPAISLLSPDQADPAGGPEPRRPSVRRPVSATRGDPYPMYARLRARGGVHRLNWSGLGPTALVVRHADARTLLGDPRFAEEIDGLAPDGAAVIPRLLRFPGRLADAFSTFEQGPAAARIREEAGRLLDAPRARGEIELIAEYAAVVPIAIVTGFIGIPIADATRFRGFAYASGVRQTTGPKSEALAASRVRFAGHVKAVLAARRQDPRDDLVSALVRAATDVDRAGLDDLAEAVCRMILDGYVSASNFIGNATLTLLRHPEQLDRLRGDPASIGTAIEELLRFESPIELSPAYRATADIDLGGIPVARGARLRVAVPSVNRDAAVFERPDSLDLARSPCPHLCFGWGERNNPGAPLARLAGRIALPALIQGAPRLALADPARVEWMAHPVLRGLLRLPLRF